MAYELPNLELRKNFGRMIGEAALGLNLSLGVPLPFVNTPVNTASHSLDLYPQPPEILPTSRSQRRILGLDGPVYIPNYDAERSALLSSLEATRSLIGARTMLAKKGRGQYARPLRNNFTSVPIPLGAFPHLPFEA
jgi:hypothetical protein